MGIVIACFLLVRMFISWLQWPIRWLGYLKVIRHDPKTLQRSLQQHIPALTTALIDFHKTQRYFMIAAQVAAIVVLQRPVAFDASSYDQLLTNYRFLSTVSLGGILPILISLVKIHGLDQRSLYMLVLSIVVSAISTTVCVLASMQYGPRSSLVLGRYTTSACSGVYVYKYCIGYHNSYIHEFTAWPLLAFAWTIYALLVLDLVAHKLNASGSL